MNDADATWLVGLLSTGLLSVALAWRQITKASFEPMELTEPQAELAVRADRADMVVRLTAAVPHARWQAIAAVCVAVVGVVVATVVVIDFFSVAPFSPSRTILVVIGLAWVAVAVQRVRRLRAVQQRLGVLRRSIGGADAADDVGSATND